MLVSSFYDRFYAFLNANSSKAAIKAELLSTFSVPSPARQSHCESIAILAKQTLVQLLRESPMIDDAVHKDELETLHQSLMQDIERQAQTLTEFQERSSALQSEMTRLKQQLSAHETNSKKRRLLSSPPPAASTKVRSHRTPEATAAAEASREQNIEKKQAVVAAIDELLINCFDSDDFSPISLKHLAIQRYLAGVSPPFLGYSFDYVRQQAALWCSDLSLVTRVSAHGVHAKIPSLLSNFHVFEECREYVNSQLRGSARKNFTSATFSQFVNATIIPRLQSTGVPSVAFRQLPDLNGLFSFLYFPFIFWSDIDESLEQKQLDPDYVPSDSESSDRSESDFDDDSMVDEDAEDLTEGFTYFISAVSFISPLIQ
jgi:uncharacterized small protein (DUF1192 family)